MYIILWFIERFLDDAVIAGKQILNFNNQGLLFSNDLSNSIYRSLHTRRGFIKRIIMRIYNCHCYRGIITRFVFIRLFRRGNTLFLPFAAHQINFCNVDIMLTRALKTIYPNTHVFNQRKIGMTNFFHPWFINIKRNTVLAPAIIGIRSILHNAFPCNPHGVGPILTQRE